MTEAPHFSLVAPVYNEEGNLRELVRQSRAALDPLDRPYEIILVDDGSTDQSPAIACELAAANEPVRYLAFAANRGQSAAFAAGFAAARGEIIVTMDADLQNDPADIPKLLARFEEGFDLVAGRRARRKDTWQKRIGSRIGNRVREMITGRTVTDTGCSLKVMRASMCKAIPPFTGMHRYLPDFAVMQGARIAEVDVHHRERASGVSKYNNLGRALAGIPDLLGMRWLKKRWTTYDLKDQG